MKINCSNCELEYKLVSSEAKEEGVYSSYCPFCGFEIAKELDFNETKYDNDSVDEWDDWYPNESFS